ncbi:MAG: RHS repeat-associated core domain-containing protein [bacterium]|nr:RHS repeat-associated core domain-containing protein [bacterium]
MYPGGCHTGDYFYHYNHRGDVVSVTDSSGSEVARYRYDAFGNVAEKAGTFDSPYQFSTKEYDDASGLIYYGYRYYDPAHGVWLSKDPIGYYDGLNLYAFVTNNPVNWTDPYGLAHFPLSKHPEYDNWPENLRKKWDDYQRTRYITPDGLDWGKIFDIADIFIKWFEFHKAYQKYEREIRRRRELSENICET